MSTLASSAPSDRIRPDPADTKQKVCVDGKIVDYVAPAVVSDNTASSIAEVRLNKKRELYVRYSELLLSGNPDLAEVAKLADGLGLSDAQVTEDVQTIKRALWMQGLIRQARVDGVADAAVKALSELKEHEAETARIISERETRRAELDKIELDASLAHRAAGGNANRLMQLIQEKPLLLNPIKDRLFK
jgi:hypothetical protein